MTMLIKNIFKSFSILSIFLFIFLSYFTSPVMATGPVTVTLSPSSGSIGKAEQIVNVNINTSTTDVNAVLLVINYDPAVLSITFQQGTIAAFNSGSIPLAGTIDNGAVTIQAGATVSGAGYTGSGLLAILKVKTLSTLATAKDTELTIDPASSKFTSGADPTTNQLTTSVLGATSTYTADPDYISTDLPSTAIFDDNRAVFVTEILLGITLVILGIRAIRNKTKNTEVL